MKVRYNYFENTDQKNRVEALFEKYKHICPSWLRELDFDKYNTSTDGDIGIRGSVNCSAAYGTATIYIYSSFFGAPLDMQHDDFRHELVHIAHGKILNFVDDRLIPDLENYDKGLAKYMRQDFRDRVEEFTQHMADIIK